MDKLSAWEESQEPWTLENDKNLLDALQTLSSDIMANIHNLDKSINDLEQRTNSLEARYHNTAYKFKSLGETQFIEQAVAEASDSDGDLQKAKRSTILSAEEIRKETYPKYEKALRMANEAFESSGFQDMKNPALPFVFGSPEYLQSSNLGLDGEEFLPSASTGQVQMEEKGEEESLPSNSSNKEELEEDDLPRAPDLRAMLEAALKGDLENLDLENLSLDDSSSENQNDTPHSQISLSQGGREAFLPKEIQNGDSEKLQDLLNEAELLSAQEEAKLKDLEKVLEGSDGNDFDGNSSDEANRILADLPDPTSSDSESEYKSSSDLSGNR